MRCWLYIPSAAKWPKCEVDFPKRECNLNSSLFPFGGNWLCWQHCSLWTKSVSPFRGWTDVQGSGPTATDSTQTGREVRALLTPSPRLPVSAFGGLHSNACTMCTNAFLHPLCPHSGTFQCEPGHPVLEILLHPWPRAKLEAPSRQSAGFTNAGFSIQSTGFGPDTFLYKGEIDEFDTECHVVEWVPI